MSQLPLLLLPDTVVFPGMTVPLHIDEERYKHLVRTVIDSEDQRFVMGLAVDDGVIGDTGPRLPRHGTYMELLNVEENIDGSYDVLAHGRERCRLKVSHREVINEPDGEKRLLLFVEDDPAPLERFDPNREKLVAWDAVDTFKRYATTFFASGTQEQVDDALPDDTFYQASFICANIRIPAQSRQILLEAPDLEARLRLASQLMEERLAAHRPARD